MTMLKVTAAALAMLPTSAFAQTAEDEIVVTASGFEQPRSETGQAIEIVDRDRLDQLQSATIADALQTIPGSALPPVAALAAKAVPSSAAAAARRHWFSSTACGSTISPAPMARLTLAH